MNISLADDSRIKLGSDGVLPTEVETEDAEARPSSASGLNTLDNIHNYFGQWTAKSWNGFAVETKGSNAAEKTGRIVMVTVHQRRWEL